MFARLFKNRRFLFIGAFLIRSVGTMRSFLVFFLYTFLPFVNVPGKHLPAQSQH